MEASGRQQRAQFAALMRVEGKTWTKIAEDFRHRYGVNARKAFRWAWGWSQSQVALEWNDRWPDEPKTFKNISTWERWPESGHEPSLTTLSRLAEIYECDLSDLVADIANHRHLDENEMTGPVLRMASVPLSRSHDWEDGTDRRTFGTGALAMLGLASPLRRLLSGDVTEGRVIGSEHLQLVESAIQRTVQRDTKLGGTEVYETAAALQRRVAAWLYEPTFDTRGVDDALQQMLGDLTAWTGWLAFDADNVPAARHFLDEAVVHARLVDDPVLEVRALSSLSMVARHTYPRESLDYAGAAQHAARGWATPRLASLLHVRAAAAHATMHEPNAFSREVTKAKSQFERGSHDDDPAFIHFFTHQELTGLEGVSYLAMGKPERAVQAFRAITDSPDPVYRRNVGFYTVRLAEATWQQGDVRGACEIVLASIPLVAVIESGRTRRRLRAIRQNADRHLRTVPTARDFADAYDDALAP